MPIHTTPEDFRFNDHVVTIPRQMFAVLADQLAQYHAYAESMRAIGRGMEPSSPFSPAVTTCFLNAVLIEARNRKGCDCVICGQPTFHGSYVSLPTGHVSHIACREAQ
jgi:hypothetical protein